MPSAVLGTAVFRCSPTLDVRESATIRPSYTGSTFLTQQLAITVGLGGRGRREGGDVAERARLHVTQQIKATLQVLRAVHPDLADHLARSVQTGLLCSYSPAPDDAPRWEL